MKPSSLRHPARLAGSSLLRLQSDARLAELASSGHEAAFDAIVDRYRTPLARYCAGIVGPSRAEDAVQQALINAHDALQRTDEVRHLRSWLYRIAHNASLNVLRAVRDDVPLDEAAQSGSLRSPADNGPAESFERSERFRATVAALQELPERQRAALVLRELEGRSHEEIAEALGVTKGSARQHLMRARVAVRGAVTAVTPYPLIVRLSELVAGPSGAGWADAAVGAGAGATIAKLTAGVAATGALVGGAVGTERIVHHSGKPSPAAAAAAERVVKRSAARVGSATPVALNGAGAAAASPTTSGDDTTVARRTGGKPVERRRAAAKDASRQSPARPQPSGGRLAAPVSPSSSESAGSDGAGDDTGNGRSPSARKNKSPNGASHGSKDKASDTSSSGKGSSGKAKSDAPGRDKHAANDDTPPSSSGKGKDKNKGEKNGNGKTSQPTPTATSPAPEPTADSGSGKDKTGKSDTDVPPGTPGNSGSANGKAPSVDVTSDD